MLEAYPGRVCVIKDDRTVVYLNPRMREAHGDLAGKKCYETSISSEGICRNCPVTLAWDRSHFPYTRTVSERDGAVIEITITLLDDDETGERYYLSFHRDVTDQHAREQYLKNLSSSLDQMTEAVAISDSAGAVVYINKAFETLMGITRDEALNLNFTTMRRSPSARLDMSTLMRECLDQGWSGDVTLANDDGATTIVNIDARPVVDEQGAAIGIIGLFRDVTRERSEKVELENYKSQLEKKMESRTSELARRVSQLTTINKISRVVTSILEPEELVKEFTKSIATGFGYRHVVIMAMDKDRGELHYWAGHGANVTGASADVRLKLKEGIIGHAAFFSETLVTGDVETDPRYVSKDAVSTKSELAIPILFRGDLIGVLDVQSEVKDAFTRNDVTLLEMLTDILATAVVNARTFTESKERERALTVLDRISKQISFRQEPDVILDQVARDAASLLKCEKALVGLRDDAQNLRWVASCNVDKSLIEKLEFSATKGVTGRAMSKLRTEVVNDYRSDPDARPRDGELFNIRSLVSAPMIIEGRAVGIVNVYNKGNGAKFTKNDAAFLTSLADHAAIALENSNLLASLNQRVRSQLALLETALSMQRQIDFGGIYEFVADKLREVIWYDGITFYKADHDRGLMVPMMARGAYADAVMADVFPIGEGLTGHVVETGKAEMVNDAARDDRAVQVEGTPEEDESMMSIPLKGKERVIGALTVYRMGKETFTPSDFEIAQLFASQAAVAVENSELYRTEEMLLRESRNKVVQMSRLLEMTTSVMYMDDLDKLLGNLVDAVVSSFGFKRASVSLMDLQRNVFVNRALSGYPEWVKVGETMPVETILEDMKDEFLVGDNTYFVKYEDQEYGIEAFDFIANPELADKPRSSPDAWHERDILMFALKDRGGRLIGYLLVDGPADLKMPSKEQVEVLEVLSGIASIAVENSRTYERQVFAVNEIALLNDLMTHDINNFNQGIMGYIELLLQDRRLDEGQRRYAEKALVQVRNNARVIDNIRKLAKVRSMSDKDFTVWDLHDPVTAAVQAVSKVYRDKAVTLSAAVPKGVHFIKANEHVNDLFFNIVSNAVKFDGSRKVKVEIAVDEVEDAHGEFWVVSVIDRGRGIPDDRKRAVFERFATGVTGVKGFGLGLSIVSTAVERFGGRIWVEDRVRGDFSQGAMFKVMLPKAAPPVREPPPDAPGPSISSSA